MTCTCKRTSNWPAISKVINQVCNKIVHIHIQEEGCNENQSSKSTRNKSFVLFERIRVFIFDFPHTATLRPLPRVAHETTRCTVCNRDVCWLCSSQHHHQKPKCLSYTFCLELTQLHQGPVQRNPTQNTKHNVTNNIVMLSICITSMSFNVFNHRGGYQIKNWGVKQTFYDVWLY